MRAKQARGKFGLKMLPLGATTVTGRNMPEFCGMNSSLSTSSSIRVRTM